MKFGKVVTDPVAKATDDAEHSYALTLSASPQVKMMQVECEDVASDNEKVGEGSNSSVKKKAKLSESTASLGSSKASDSLESSLSVLPQKVPGTD